MGLIIKGTIPRVPPFSLWFMGFLRHMFVVLSLHGMLPYSSPIYHIFATVNRPSGCWFFVSSAYPTFFGKLKKKYDFKYQYHPCYFFCFFLYIRCCCGINFEQQKTHPLIHLAWGFTPSNLSKSSFVKGRTSGFVRASISSSCGGLRFDVGVKTIR